MAKGDNATTTTATTKNTAANTSSNGTIDSADSVDSADDTTTTPVARKAAFGTAISLLLRILSFGCTQWTFRMLSPVALGRASIRLELLLTTVLFISREGFRLALTRGTMPKHDVTAWNVAWLSVPLGALVSMAALAIHLLSSQTTDLDYQFAGMLYCLATFIESCGEPPVLSCLHRLDLATRAAAEGTATLGKTATLVFCLQQSYLSDNFPVTAFGISQLVYAMLFTALLYSRTWSVLQWPAKAANRQQWIPLQQQFHGPTCYLTALFTLQGFFKHILTEGDKLVLTSLGNEYDQGVYAMGSAYGGMAARILLQPMEENARLLWSQQSAHPPARNGYDALELSFTVLVKLVVYIGLVFATIAVHYTSVLLKLLAGAKWGSNEEATAVLSAFCVYTALLAFNGTTEAFVYGVAVSGKEIGRLGMAHTMIGLLFAGLATLLVSMYGTVGLVAANGVAMVLRSIYSLHFVARFFVQRQNKGSSSVLNMAMRLSHKIMPHPVVLLLFGLSWASTNLSLQRLRLAETELFGDIMYSGLSRVWLLLALQHIAVAIVCMMGIVVTMYLFEGDLRQSLRTLFRNKQD